MEFELKHGFFPIHLKVWVPDLTKINTEIVPLPAFIPLGTVPVSNSNHTVVVSGKDEWSTIKKNSNTKDGQTRKVIKDNFVVFGDTVQDDYYRDGFLYVTVLRTNHKTLVKTYELNGIKTITFYTGNGTFITQTTDFPSFKISKKMEKQF